MGDLLRFPVERRQPEALAEPEFVIADGWFGVRLRPPGVTPETVGLVAADGTNVRVTLWDGTVLTAGIPPPS